MEFIVYEIWTTARKIEALSEEDAYQKGEPSPRDDLNLANWHVVPVQPVIESPLTSDPSVGREDDPYDPPTFGDLQSPSAARILANLQRNRLHLAKD